MGTAIEHILESLPVIGFLTLVYLGFKLMFAVHSFYKIYFTEENVDYKSFGKWALVTGSTDGIGKGIAFNLAKRGINIILVSRNPEKLKSVAEEIETQFKVQTRCIAIDFSKCDPMEDGGITSSMYDVIASGIEGLEIGILVNNVGLGASGEFLNAFSKSKDKDVSTGIPKLVYCNDLSMSRVTQLVLPGMVGRKKGLIINMSSLAASTAMPNSSIYSASKKFNDTFSRALSQEYKDEGIIVQTVRPGMVRTNMTSREKRKAAVNYPEYDVYADHLMKTLGKNQISTGYWFHGLLQLLITSFPEETVCKFVLHARK